MAETKADELHRLVDACEKGERQNRQEAWNLIADFAVENRMAICAGLRVVEQSSVNRTRMSDFYNGLAKFWAQRKRHDLAR